jgi:hypothetical protein
VKGRFQFQIENLKQPRICNFSFKMCVAEKLACIGFTEILEVSATVAEKSCKLKSMDRYCLLDVLRKVKRECMIGESGPTGSG